jgi:hypothetical protein
VGPNLADQLWGIIARRIAHSDVMLTPEDVIRIITLEMQRPGLRAWLGAQTAVTVSKLDAVRDWRQHMPLARIGLAGGLLEDSSSNHVFVFILRRDLPDALALQCDNGRYPRTHIYDVIVLVKRHICSAALAQSPMLVLPYKRASPLALVPLQKAARRAAGDVKWDWVKLANALVASYGAVYQGAADYLKALADGSAAIRAVLRPLPWHSVVECAPIVGPSSFVPSELVLAAISPSIPLRAIWRRG